MQEMLLCSGKVPLPEGNIKRFDTTSRGIVALSDSGRLYSIGDQMVSGTGGTVTTWTLVITDVEDFSAGYNSLLIRMLDGRWMFMGLNYMFPTSIGSTVTTPTDVSEFMQYPEGLTVRSFSISGRSVGVVFTDGQYAMCGLNGSGGLGQGNTTAVRGLAMRSDFTTVKKLVFDPVVDTSYLLLENGRAYVAGDSSYGQAGSISASIPTWTLQQLVCVDIFVGFSGWFMVTQPGGTRYAVYVQGRQFDGSLGTGNSSNSNVTNPTAVWQNINDITKGSPVIYTGLYSARVTHPVTGVLYFTGTNSGNSQGTGPNQQPRYSFTAMSGDVLQGEYHGLKNMYQATYLLIDGNLYGTGKDTTVAGILPGVPTTGSDVYVPLDTSLIV